MTMNSPSVGHFVRNKVGHIKGQNKLQNIQITKFASFARARKHSLVCGSAGGQMVVIDFLSGGWGGGKDSKNYFL